MFKLTRRGRILVVVAAIFVALSLFVESEDAPLLTFTGLGLFLYVYVTKLTLEIHTKVVSHLRYDRITASRAAEGEDLEVDIKVENPSFMQLQSVEVVDHYPSTFKLIEGSNSATLSIPGHGETVLHYKVSPTSVGRHIFDHLHILVRDLGAIFYYEADIPLKTSVHVRPEIQRVLTPITATALSSYSGTLTSRRKGEGFEFAEIREYTPSDEYRKIEWRSTARLNRLMVRETLAETHLHVMIILDASKSMIYGLRGQTKLDYSARAVATLLNYLSRRGDFIGLTVYDGLNVGVKPLSRGQLQLYRLLDSLSSISPVSESKEMFPSAIRRAVVEGGVRGRGLFFVISDLEGDLSIIIDQFRMMKVMRHEVVIVSPYSPLFEIGDLAGVDQIAYRIHTSYSWNERKESVRAIERMGIPIFHVGPKDLIPGLLTQVEELRRRGGS
ncbi:MAG: DUF58 domain-containing protein [Nitrososphaerales archaeon]